MRILVYIFIFSLGILPIKAQYMTNLFDNIDKDTAVYNFEMPELRYLIEAAHEYHAYHRMQDAQMRNFVSQIEAKRREWMDHFYIDADIRYGLYNYIFLGGANQNAPGIAPVDNQFSYYVAFSVRIPLSVFSKTKHEIRALEHTIDQHKAYQEQLNDELTRIVIEEYYLMLTFKEQMISFQDVMQTLRAMYMKILRDFERGYVPMDDVRVVAEAKAKAETDFYKAKNEFFMHTEKLMAMTGYKLKPVER
jgi:outer membrane protein TolC